MQTGPARFLGVALIALGAAITGGPDAAQAQTARFQVGIPGCADDVAVRASREAITFQSRGRSIRAWLYAPGGEPNGAGVIMLHGGSGFEMNAILFDAHAIQLASRGYWVVLPAYFDAAAPDQSRPVVTARAWRQAALDAASQLAARPGVKADRLVFWGYSRGAGVAVDAVTDPASVATSAVLAAGGGSFDESLGVRDLAFLMLHARRDEAVPVRSTLHLAADLREAGAAVEVRELAFAGHQYDLPTWCTVFSLTRDFVDRVPGGGS